MLESSMTRARISGAPDDGELRVEARECDGAGDTWVANDHLDAIAALLDVLDHVHQQVESNRVHHARGAKIDAHRVPWAVARIRVGYRLEDGQLRLLERGTGEVPRYADAHSVRE